MMESTVEPMIEAIVFNLKKVKPLYTELDASLFARNDIPPYYSSIGSHLRHTLDIFCCVLQGMKSGVVDFTLRKRDSEVETRQESGYQYFTDTCLALQHISVHLSSEPLMLVDDLGLGELTIQTNLGSILAQANNHSIHHFAYIGYLLHSLGVKHLELSFGYNPTTPPSRSFVPLNTGQ
ncbi:hypothetical protein [Endozoicomonas sp. Mp262]|uniref:hypothetical protein n=1 Tax=Endozoicomonas sp. Mp262 TaxID=2919499 RepID=UPI0021D9BD0D